MAPTLSSKDNQNLEDTIAKVYETLKRTENRTLETKRRAAKTLQDSSQHLSTSLISGNFLNPDRFSESLNYIDDTGRQIRLVSAPRYSTLGNRGQTHHTLQPKTQVKKERGKKTVDNTNKVRNIIFKTLDRLFQLPNKPVKSPIQNPQQNQSPSKSIESSVTNCSPPNSYTEKPLSLEALKLLNQNATDTLPREHSVANPKNENVELQLCSTVAFSCDESSSEDETWEFIPAPLKFKQVTLEDTLEFSSNADIVENKIKDSLSNNEIVKKNRKSRYQRKVKRGSKSSKIQKRAQERQSVKEILKVDEAVLQLDEIPKNIEKRRADSPIQKRKANIRTLTPAISLPNLIALQECESASSTLSDCGTDTFTRNIAYCASSTLSKSIPSFSENHLNDEDACSSSSSFSSLQRIHHYNNDTTNRSTHESTLPVVPSALCDDILVTPITVPINPLGRTDNKTIGISPETFKELTEVYRPKIKEPSNQHVTSTIHEKNDFLGNQNQQSTLTTNSTGSGGDEKNEVEKSHDSTIKFESISLSPTNDSLPPTPPRVPPPPRMPPPPPLPTSSPPTNTLVRGLLPVPIFTQPQTGNCIFTEMKQISIDEGDVKRLQENFPLKSKLGCKRLKRLLGKGQCQELSPEEKKFLRHIELFLRRYRIQDFQPLLQSINTLNAGDPQVETEWFSTLIQCIPKAEEIVKIQRGNRLQKSVDATPAEKFATELLNIRNLHDKLLCIQFSLDFKESSAKVFKWADSFIRTCNKIRMCDKFVKLINVIICLLQSSLDQSGEQSKIYGFDIQGLTKLATSKSADSSSTYLQFVIEYILNKPEHSDSVDFYKEFADLADMTKTSIQEINAQCDEWQKTFQAYCKQYDQIMQQNQDYSVHMNYATRFRKTTEETLPKLVGTLAVAQESFNTCKERFGLMNSETTEVMFFESLSNFVIAYKNTYGEILERNDKASKQSTISKQTGLDGTALGTPENVNSGKPGNDIPKQRKSNGLEMLSKIKKEAVSPKKRSPIKSNLQGRTSEDFQDILDSSTTKEVGKGLMGLLMKKDNGNIRRLRKSGGNSSSKLQIGLHREK